jgi:hypothetical protein
MSLTTVAPRTARTGRARRGRVGLAAAAAAVAALVGLSGSAQAAQVTTRTLAPGASACVTQYAGFQARGTGWATADGARFKLLRNGQVVVAAPGRSTSWSAEVRSAYGNFPGPGYYAVCAHNTGTRNTTVTLELRTDAEI